MAKSLDKVLQPDGTYKWELVEPTHDEMMGNDPITACPAPVETCPAPAPKETKKKVSKKKTTSPLSD